MKQLKKNISKTDADSCLFIQHFYWGLERMVSNKLKYPVVFVHGMFGWGESKGFYDILPYWGSTSGDMIKWLNDCGYKCYASTVGPMASSWDQACELYAQLKGTTVDYGQVHSKRHGHDRFGRTYKKPLVPEWNSENKIHLLGHSFGGNCVRLLAHLLANGAPEEAEASGDDVSELFKGGNSDLLCSITAVCAMLGTASAYEAAIRFKLLPILREMASTYSAVTSNTKLSGKVVDIQLEHYGVSRNPNENTVKTVYKTIKKFQNGEDCVQFDMSPEGIKRVDSYARISKNNYYFSYPFNVVHKYKNTNLYLPLGCNFKFLTLTSSLIRLNALLNGNKDAERENDGLVEVSVASYPATEPHVDFDQNSIRKGVWNVMPVTTGDHGSAIGFLSGRFNTRIFYQKHMNLLEAVEAVSLKNK